MIRVHEHKGCMFLIYPSEEVKFRADDLSSSGCESLGSVLEDQSEESPRVVLDYSYICEDAAAREQSYGQDFPLFKYIIDSRLS